jgi:hypothetical protein
VTSRIHGRAEDAVNRFMEETAPLIPKAPLGKQRMLFGRYEQPELDAQVFFVLSERCAPREMIDRVGMGLAATVVMTAAREAGMAQLRHECAAKITRLLGKALVWSLKKNLETTIRLLESQHQADGSEELDPAFQHFVQKLFGGEG